MEREGNAPSSEGSAQHDAHRANAQTRVLLDLFVRQGARSHEQLGVLRSRRMVELSVALQGDRPPVHSTEDILVDGPAGRLPVRIYRQPDGPPRPLLVYLHGGGWVTGSVEVADIPCRLLAAATGAVVASVEYRRAPETPFPGPLDDCYAAVQHLAALADSFGADARRLVLVGDSAGANLAAATALLTRDRGGAPIAHQVLLYPALLPARGSPYRSYAENAEGFSLTAAAMEWFWSMYVGGDGTTRDPLAAPLLEHELAGLPSATIATVELDPLRDEGVAYVERLRSAGVPVTHLPYPGTIHGFFWMAGHLDQARVLVGDVAAAVRRAVGASS